MRFGQMGLSALGFGAQATATPTPAPTPGTAATVFTTTPAVHYHFDSQAVSVDGSDRLASCADLRGLADLLAISGTTAPKLMTDGLGRQFLRFNGNEAAAIANALTVATNRSFMVVMVGRVHHQRSIVAMMAPRFASYTSPTVNTTANSSFKYLQGTVVSSGGCFLQAFNPLATDNAADCHKVIPGCQMQVMALASRVTASGGTRAYINNDSCDTGQQGTEITNRLGAVVGGLAAAGNNTETPTTSVNNVFDLYELAFWNTGPGNVDADANVAAAVANYAIPQLDTNLVVEGDSITDGVATALPVSPAWSGGLGSRLTEPGAERVPGNVRVINLGQSGNQVSHLTTKRDATNSTFGTAGRYPGGAAKNIVAVQIGRNDLNTTAGTAAAHYTNVVALLNTTSTGYLQRGWRVAVAANIAGSSGTIAGSPSDGPITLQQRIEAFRAMIMSGTAAHATFLGDTLSGVGQAYEGLVSVLPISEITASGDTKFKTNADALDTGAGFYNSDQTHLTVAGIDLMVSGGDSPAYGYGAVA